MRSARGGPKARVLMVLLVALALTGLASGAALAAPHGQGGQHAQANQSNVAHLYLYEKDATWSIVEDGAWGKMTYRVAAPEFRFVFNGHGLVPATKYTLIYYPDPWPGNGLKCLGTATANRGGNIHIAGSVELDTNLPVPPPFDTNYPTGAKIWLVLTADVTCGVHMDGWNPTEYLFESNLITFDGTDT